MKQVVRQTRTHIGDLLARHGLRPRHDLGQNFLVDLNLLDFLVVQAEIGPSDLILEIGSGTGSLTAALALQAGAVISVEVDAHMQRLTADAVEGFTNVTLLGSDVLKNKNHFSAEVLDALDRGLRDTGLQLKLVANLPYGVATPVISNLVASAYPWERMVVTIQYELAQRMVAKESTADYSALSVWLQSQCRLEILKRLPPDVFWPRPKVASAMIRIDPDPALRAKIASREFLHQFLRGVFQQRRKVLRNVLIGMYRRELDRTQIDDVLKSRELKDDARAEQLSPAQLVDLSNDFFKLLGTAADGTLPVAEDS
ncbi:MAG TPA: 16S rRNA (adenine(1518)-N(6)/adenine(1519)-N(6))-dimethyltransferase RsmA [Planctomycetaceae bacterium]|jgi:16S rRNA (adenine1518-N6/adenine1519-N6)-dimethyltransferase|nr:16S rRNA (adenine(1518)-N(6)/adenine(1519)-N(6))-dimethyltransferase RsmA [Planctomycetaceae bacterium]